MKALLFMLMVTVVINAQPLNLLGKSKRDAISYMDSQVNEFKYVKSTSTLNRGDIYYYTYIENPDITVMLSMDRLNSYSGVYNIALVMPNIRLIRYIDNFRYKFPDLDVYGENKYKSYKNNYIMDIDITSSNTHSTINFYR